MAALKQCHSMAVALMSNAAAVQSTLQASKDASVQSRGEPFLYRLQWQWQFCVAEAHVEGCASWQHSSCVIAASRAVPLMSSVAAV